MCHLQTWLEKEEQRGWQAAEVHRLYKDNPSSVLIWRCFAFATGLHNSCHGKKKSSENDVWSGDLVAAGPVYLQVGEG